MLWNRFRRRKVSATYEMPKAPLLLTAEVEEKDYVPFEECQPKGEEEILPDSPSDTEPSDDVEEEHTDIYALRNEEYKRKQEQHRQDVIAAIIEYTQIRPIAHFAGFDLTQMPIFTSVSRVSNVSEHKSTVENAQ